MSTRPRRLVLLGAMLAAVLAAACGASPLGSQTPVASKFNSADVTFAQEMIPHHQQAIQMAKLAATNASDPGVKQLAASIEAAQGPEIRIMQGWLRSWGKPIPSAPPGMTGPAAGASPAPMPTMHQMPGMMSQQEMSQLASTHGVAFDRMFLEMMIRHHQGAVAMARTEQAQGINADAKRLAKEIETSQSAQIQQMRQMLRSMPPH